MTTKICTRCLKTLPLSCFTMRNDVKKPLPVAQCKTCRKQQARIRHKTRDQSSGRIWPCIDVRENNAFNLWHGPVSRHQPLRSLA